MKNKSKLKKLFKIIAVAILIAAAVALYCFRGIISAWLESFSVKNQSQQLQTIYENEPEKPEIPGQTEHYEMNPKFAELYAINSHTIGWLKAEGIGADLPVVLFSDNSYYLKHDFYGEESRHGTLFVSCYNVLDRNSPLYPDDNVIIYGHNMLDGIMFANLSKYKNADFAGENMNISFDTLYENVDYVVFAAFITNTLPEHGEPFLYNTMRRFENASEKQTFIDAVKSRSYINTDIDVSAEDYFLTLSTCSYEFDDARFVVVARKLREGEKPEDFSGDSVTKNPSPLMLDIWNELYGK